MKKYIVKVACIFDIEIDPEEMDKDETTEYISMLPVDDVMYMRTNYFNDSIEDVRVIAMKEVED